MVNDPPIQGDCKAYGPWPVGSRAGAVLRRRGLSVSPRFLWECLTSRTVSPFPACAFYLFIRAPRT